MNETYKVRLAIQQTRTIDGTIKNHYKVLRVLEFHPARVMLQHDWVADAPPED